MKQFAIIGCGAISRIHAKAIQSLDNGNLYGVYDTRRESAEKFAAEYKGCKVFSTLDELFSCEEIDVVNVCVPSGLHAELTIKAAKAGKHVIVEKPMAITKEQLDNIINVTQEHNTKVAVITQLRFTPAFQKVKEAIDSGRLGKILLADFRGKYYRAPEYYSSCGWRGTWEMDGGGALMNQGIHGIDLIQYLMGGVKSVYALCRTQDRDIEAEDSAYLIVEYKNGAIGSMHGTTVAKPGYPRVLEITGTKGTIKIEEDEIMAWDIDGEKVETKHASFNAGCEPLAFTHEYHKMQFADLLEAIEQDRKPMVDAEEGRKPVDIILAAYESNKTGKRIDLE
ncbi:MAG: Gfo/Idh/MocA family oxidoreductase [Clostridiales bacterium]|nr:Gfo/Idh/MocA family oxidoreductase [Clostridiales bacterium]